MREIDEIFIPLKKSHNGNIQENMDDVVVLAISSSRSDPIQRCKWRCLREMHMYSAPTTLPSRSSEIWWSGRWDRQHDGMVSMVESFCRQGFACLHGGRRTEKGGFRNRAADPRKLGHTKPAAPCSFYRCRTSCLGAGSRSKHHPELTPGGARLINIDQLIATPHGHDPGPSRHKNKVQVTGSLGPDVWRMAGPDAKAQPSHFRRARASASVPGGSRPPR
jgi:hypothetical protein